MESLKSFLIKTILTGLIIGAASAAAPDLSSYQYKSRYLAEYSIFKIDVQYIGLHVSKKYQNANEIIQDSSNKVLKVEYLRELSKSTLKKAWGVSYEAVLGENNQKYKDQIKKIKSFTRDVDEGDIVYVVFSKDGLRYFLNDNMLGEINDPEFAKVTLSIWIGESPVDDDMKEGILKGIIGK